MTLNQEFGNRLRELRKAAGLTLRDLAERVGVNFTYLSKIETGVLPPPSERVIRLLARELGCDKDDFLALAGIIPADLAEILKDRQARVRLRAEQARKEAKMARQSQPVLANMAVPWKGLYRLALPVFLVVAVALSIWFASPTQALQIQYPSQPTSGVLGSTYTFTVKVNIEDGELLPMESITVVIYNVSSPDTCKATLASLPLATSAAAAHNPTEGSGSGTATVAASADAHWGYSASGDGTVDFGGTGYSFPGASGGYGYQGGTGTTSITYTIVWTSPSGWPSGSYMIRTILTTSAQSPGGATTFTQTSSSFTLSSLTPAAGGGGAGSPGGTTSLSGMISGSGVFLQDVTARSSDSKVNLTIATGATGKNKFGQPLYQITIAPISPPAPPANTDIVGLAYSLGPNGATFDPPAILTFTYDPASLPAGASEANLTLAYYDSASGSWMTLASTVDAAANTITAQVSHFTTFAIMTGSAPASFSVTGLIVTPAAVTAGGTVSVSAVIHNTGDLAGSFDAVLRVNSGIVETRTLTLAGHSTQEVNFSITPDAAGSYEISIDGLSATLEVVEPAPTSSTTTTTAPTSTTTMLTTTTTSTPAATSTLSTTSTTQPGPGPQPGVNWLLIGGIIAVVIIVGIVTWQILYRRNY